MRRVMALSLSLVAALVVACGGDDSTSTRAETTTDTLPTGELQTPYPTSAALGFKLLGYRTGEVYEAVNKAGPYSLNFPRSELPERVANAIPFIGALKIPTRYGSLILYDYGSLGAARKASHQVPGHVITRYGVWIVTGPSGVSKSEVDSLGFEKVLAAPIQ